MPVSAAQTLLDSYWDRTLPVNLDLFLDPLGLNVEEVSMDETSASGSISGDKIKVNAADSEPRKRFTIAHEIGHFYLGHGNRFRNTVLRTYEPEEIAANAFAAELLMPAIAMKVLIELHREKDPARLREIFNVSAEALRIRLKALGYID